MDTEQQTHCLVLLYELTKTSEAEARRRIAAHFSTVPSPWLTSYSCVLPPDGVHVTGPVTLWHATSVTQVQVLTFADHVEAGETVVALHRLIEIKKD